MGYRKTTKKKSHSNIFLVRNTLSANQVLTLDFDLCVGCDICEKVCPEKAITKSPPKIVNGRLIGKGQVNIDEEKCVFCGICVILCPLNAIRIEVNGEEKIPVVENDVFPLLIRQIAIDVAKCTPDCNLVCKEKCPTNAIKVVLEAQRIIDVRVDKRLCVFCKKCEVACPLTNVRVTKPIQGIVKINTELCPEACQACVDICPTKCINLYDIGKPIVENLFCIYCGACQEICPKNAITVERTKVLHTKTKSGAWNETLEKLTSHKTLVKELNVKCAEKIYERVAALEESISAFRIHKL